MSSLVKTLSVFPRERVIVTRERAKGSYSTAPYLAAKLAAELPIGELIRGEGGKGEGQGLLVGGRKRAKGSYSTAPYLAAKLVAELPIGELFVREGGFELPMGVPRLRNLLGDLILQVPSRDAIPHDTHIHCPAEPFTELCS